ncbi:MAG: hypothetical protein QM765_30495 [Myxococcales bacterium]
MLPTGLKLGLWVRGEVAPPVTAAPGGSELCFKEPSTDAVRARLAEWREKGLRIVQEPVQMDFGFTFTAIDPDGHRLRVFAPQD